MKTAFAVALMFALFAGPAICPFDSCAPKQGEHDCCPKSKTQNIAPCPFNFMQESTGAIKVAPPDVLAVAGPVHAPEHIPLFTFDHEFATSVALERDLNVLNRVFRI